MSDATSIARAPARVALLALALGAATSLAGESALAERAKDAAAPPCLVSVEAPETALVGEQIVLRVRTLRRPDVGSATWTRGLVFHGFRADPLPGRSGDARVREGDATYLVFEERHALFPVRAGVLALPTASLECALHTLPGETPRSVSVSLPARSVRVASLPEAGAPPSARALVGSVAIRVESSAETVPVGESVHLVVSVEGDADLRDATPPFAAPEAIPGAELFARRPRLEVDPGDRLRLRRTFAYDVVPRTAGVLRIPPVRIPTFDPATRRYGEASSEALEIRVTPAPGS